MITVAKAKIIKRKRRIRLERIASLLFVLAAVVYLGAKCGLKAYNQNLQKVATQAEEKVSNLKTEVGKLEDEVINLQSRDRVVGMAEKKGLKTNQEQVVVMGEDLEEK